MTLKIEKFIRKVRPVEAVKVTQENIREVADWCGGLHIPAPGLSSEPPTTQDYIHVPVSNPNSPAGNKAFPDMWLVREDFRRYRIVNNKSFKSGYDQIEKPKPAAPKPTAPIKKPEPTQVGAVEVVPGTPPDEGSSLTTGTVPEIDDGFTDAERAEYAALEAEENKPKLGEHDGRRSITEAIKQDNEKEQNVEEMSSEVTPDGDDLVADDLAEESETAEDVQHDEMPADVVPGDMNDPEQPEADADGTVQLGVPLEETRDLPSTEVSPELCGSCGSIVVDGVCSKDIDHDIFGTAEGVEEPDALPGD